MQKQKALTLMYSSVSKSSSVLSRVVMRWTFLFSPSSNTKTTNRLLCDERRYSKRVSMCVHVCDTLGGHTYVLWALQTDFSQEGIGRHIKCAHFELRAQTFDFQTQDGNLQARWKTAQLNGQLQKVKEGEKIGAQSPLGKRKALKEIRWKYTWNFMTRYRGIEVCRKASWRHTMF